LPLESSDDVAPSQAVESVAVVEPIPRADISPEFFARYDEIVRGLYRAASGATTWSEVCTLIARILGVTAFQIIGVDRQTGAIRFSWDGGTLPGEVMFEYFTRYHQINPRIKYGISAPPSTWIHDHETFDDETFRNHPFYRDFVDTYGIRNSSGYKLIENDELVVFFSAHPHKSRPPLSLAETSALERLGSHISESVLMHQRLQGGAADTLVAAAMLDAIDQPILLIDDSRTVHHANLSAKQILKSSESISLKNGLLHLTDPADSNRLSFALRAIGLVGEVNDRGLRSRAAMRVGVKHRPPEFVLVAVAVRPELTGGVFGHFRRAIVLLHPLDNPRKIDSLVIGHAFGLTPAESAVAAALANGASVKELARQRCVSIATIRTQVRQVLVKVGANRQSDLAQTLHQLPFESMASNTDLLVL